MKLWKKLALGSVVAISAISLTACSNNSNSNESKSSNKQLTLWVDTARVSWYKGVVKDFEKEHPNIKVKVTQNLMVQLMQKLMLLKTLQKPQMYLVFQMTN